MTPEIRTPETWARYGWMVESVAERHGITADDVLGRSRHSRIVHARHSLIFSLWASGLAFAEIGRMFGMDHTSIMYAVRKRLA